jgi:hypothetical protein
MRYLSRLVIPVSMMVVVATVAGKSAHAQSANEDTGSDSSALAPAASDTDTTTTDESQPRRKRRAKVAEAAPVDGNEPSRFGGPAEHNHRLQTGLSIMPGSGYRLIVRYRDSQSCHDPSGIESKPICSRRLPTFMDVQLAFGALARMDVIVDLRFGLEKDPAASDSHQFAVAPGFRFWLDQEIAFKFYSTLQFVYDYTYFRPGTDTPASDYGLRNANGLMYDPIRNVGFYVQFGESIGVRRWFRIDLDVGLGAQLRFP